MAISISPVRAEDVDLLVRKVEFPAHQDSPLNLLIFPRSKERQPEQIEDEVRWMIDGLREAVYREDESLYKACGEDGLPVGLIGWTTSSGVPGACAARQGSKVMSTSSCIPSSLDVESWLGVSKTLREERRRVLRDFHDNGVYRVTFMAVDPSHQRQGIGSALLEMFCRVVDEHALDAFVSSSPAGIRLYSKFGFKAVDVVETSQGTFTSMLRPSGSSLRGNIALSS